MRLDGGIEEYTVYLNDGFAQKRHLTENKPYGRKVKYLQQNGWSSDKEFANKYLHKNQILTVKEIYVGRSSSEVEFVEFPNLKFNTVMFEDVKEELND